MNKKSREVIFFILALCLFILAVRSYSYLVVKIDMNHNGILFLIGVIYVAMMIGIFFSAKLNNNSEGFWDVSAYSQCKGGPYFWQGDSETAKMCREFAKTPEGRIGISSYNCLTGFNGQPSLPFIYTPMSDDNWQNQRCDDNPTCKGKDVGLCGTEKQVE